ncbi:MAG: hypothetical protein AAGI12_11810 [Pseudomonadota bacterium]
MTRLIDAAAWLPGGLYVWLLMRLKWDRPFGNANDTIDFVNACFLAAIIVFMMAPISFCMSACHRTKRERWMVFRAIVGHARMDADSLKYMFVIFFIWSFSVLQFLILSYISPGLIDQGIQLGPLPEYMERIALTIIVTIISWISITLYITKIRKRITYPDKISTHTEKNTTEAMMKNSNQSEKIGDIWQFTSFLIPSCVIIYISVIALPGR